MRATVGSDRLQAKRARAELANQLLRTIASCGRHFFEYQGRVTFFEVADTGHVWLTDKYSKKRIWTHYAYDWRGFTEGGTLRALCGGLRDFIRTGRQLYPLTFGPWPGWLDNEGGGVWGYGEDMAQVRAAAATLGITSEKKAC